MSESIRCPRCQSETINRNGRNSDGKQVYLCKECGYRFIESIQGRRRPSRVHKQQVRAELLDVICRSVENITGSGSTELVDLLMRDFMIIPRPKRPEQQPEQQPEQ